MTDNYSTFETGAANTILRSTDAAGVHTPHTNSTIAEIATAKPIAEIFFDNVTVTTAGTQVTLGTTQALTSGITVTAQGDNTGIIFAGKNTVDSATGQPLIAGGSTFIPCDDINDVWIDASVSGEKAGYVAW